MLHEELQQHASTVITVTQYTRPGNVISAHSRIYITHYEKLVCLVFFQVERFQFSVEFLFGNGICLKCMSVQYTMMIVMNWLPRRGGVGT